MHIEYYLLGLVVALISIFLIKKFISEQEHLSYIWGLVLIAVIYIGFALWGQASDWYFIEFGGLIIYGFFAFLGYKYSYWILALGWVLHVFWDINLHMLNNVDFVPVWYAPFCLTFDIVFAAYIIYRKDYWLKKSAN